MLLTSYGLTKKIIFGENEEFNLSLQAPIHYWRRFWWILEIQQSNHCYRRCRFYVDVIRFVCRLIRVACCWLLLIFLQFFPTTSRSNGIISVYILQLNSYTVRVRKQKTSVYCCDISQKGRAFIFNKPYHYRRGWKSSREITAFSCWEITLISYFCSHLYLLVKIYLTRCEINDLQEKEFCKRPSRIVGREFYKRLEYSPSSLMERHYAPYYHWQTLVVEEDILKLRMKGIKTFTFPELSIRSLSTSITGGISRGWFGGWDHYHIHSIINEKKQTYLYFCRSRTIGINLGSLYKNGHFPGIIKGEIPCTTRLR